MKQLVTATTIEQFLTSHKDVFPVTNDTLITPSAADLAKTKGIKFVAEGEITTGSAMEIKQTSDMLIQSQLVLIMLMLLRQQLRHLLKKRLHLQQSLQ
jgi:ethanolamine utilization cobalamin adenosyltransferase